MAISYETIWAAERKLPRNAYLELDAQPAMMTPYTPIDVIAITYSKPASMLASTNSGLNGTTAHAASAGAIVIAGASTNRNLLAPVGMMISLNSSLRPSAIGWAQPPSQGIPKKLTRFGPMRTCI